MAFMKCSPFKAGAGAFKCIISLSPQRSLCTEGWGSSPNVSQLVSGGPGPEPRPVRVSSPVLPLFPYLYRPYFSIRHCITFILFCKDPAIGLWKSMITMLILFINAINFSLVVHSKCPWNFIPKAIFLWQSHSPDGIQPALLHVVSRLRSFLCKWSGKIIPLPSNFSIHSLFIARARNQEKEELRR